MEITFISENWVATNVEQVGILPSNGSYFIECVFKSGQKSYLGKYSDLEAARLVMFDIGHLIRVQAEKGQSQVVVNWEDIR